MPLIDHAARETALDITRSFIVQAPAGSGKTGLLTQRILALLGSVEQPEEIVAITFTRKAAAEMKQRVLQSLANKTPPPPTDSFALKTWDLAQIVLQRDHQRQWRLQENPNRLHIMTIDALCHAIVGQLPLLTELGGKATLTDHPQLFYQRAARETLDVLDVDVPWKWAVVRLFKHLDNDWARIESMLSDLLARRDQWLRHVGQGADDSLHNRLNASLKAMIRLELQTVHGMIPPPLWRKIVPIMDFSRRHLAAINENGSPWIGRTNPPGSEVEDVSLWHELAETLLTRDGGWRKQLNVRNGFPPKSKASTSKEGTLWDSMKKETLWLIDLLAGVDHLDEVLHAVRQVPAALYSQQQWEILQALLTLLKVAAGHLMVQFATQEVVDHAEVARRAILALGATDDPSELALRLDHRIRHLLVDEFQDTSRLQYELLERLVAGWELGGGNTLFLVGDPMQSIYRFREADVGLFLTVQREGIGVVKTVPLHLVVNFRSVPGIVNWVNAAMRAAFPAMARPEMGAVPFQASQANSQEQGDTAVTIQGCDDHEAEAREAVNLAAQAMKQHQSVCILTRTRNHLIHILPLLDEEKLRYQAVDLFPLAGRMVIKDLLALTRALIHPGDRIAWLALLRAPWCGLSLADLLVLTRGKSKATILDCLNHPECDDQVSAVGKTILARVRPILNAALAQRGQWSPFPGPGALRRWIEGTWRQLGAPATLDSPHHLEDAKSFFNLLETMESGGLALDAQTLENGVSNLFSGIDPRSSQSNLVVMTIHKAKGLEFDCVIIPGIDRQPRPDSAQLLLWMDPPVQPGVGLLEEAMAPLLAPIGSWDGGNGDPIYRFVQGMEQEKAHNEVCRLLYVAVTRAKKRLHLLGLSQKVEGRPASGSFLATLWSFVGQIFATREDELELDETSQEEARIIPPHFRLHPDWHWPPRPPWMGQSNLPAIRQGDPILFDWVGTEARLVGVVMHRFLARMVTDGVEQWSPTRIAQYQDVFRNHLVALGMAEPFMEVALERVTKGLVTALTSQRGRWVLDSQHQESRAEWGVTGVEKTGTVSVTIDRSFVDREGNRWIIDFKTSRHEGGDREGFLANERLRYQEQMDRYARLVRAMECRPIRLGLYFPLMDAWLEWSWG
ncbi:MAG: UvrD-helicase domain-containing protein [Nitrospirae bacterium]|nr:UvrD-helicase domain-containing protein [Magnetococcales bacterium]